MVADPTATPVTGTFEVDVLAGNTTLAGTVALLGSLEIKVTVKPPAGAGACRFSVRFCVAPTARAKLPAKFNPLPTTCTGFASPVKPGAPAVIVAVPKFTPVTCG